MTKEQFKMVRDKLGMTQERFAEALYVSRPHVTLIEQGRKKILLRLEVQVRELAKKHRITIG